MSNPNKSPSRRTTLLKKNGSITSNDTKLVHTQEEQSQPKGMTPSKYLFWGLLVLILFLYYKEINNLYMVFLGLVGLYLFFLMSLAVLRKNPDKVEKVVPKMENDIPEIVSCCYNFGCKHNYGKEQKIEFTHGGISGCYRICNGCPCVYGDYCELKEKSKEEAIARKKEKVFYHLCSWCSGCSGPETPQGCFCRPAMLTVKI
jgi:hypothetical protein